MSITKERGANTPNPIKPNSSEIVLEKPRAKVPNSSKILSVALLFTAVVAGGALGWRGLRENKLEDLVRAEVSLKQVCRAKPTSEASVSSAAQKVNEATRSLQQIPNLPGFEYQEAQTTLAQYASCTRRIQATQNLFQARALNQRGAAIDQNASLPLTEWKAIQADLNQSIQLLTTPSQDPSVAKQAKQELAIARSKLVEVNRRIQREEAASQAIDQAEALYRESGQMIQNPSNPEALLVAQEKLKTAVRSLETVAANTTTYAKAQENLSVYQQQLKDIQAQYATQQLKPLVREFENLAESVDLSMAYPDYAKQFNQLKDKFANLSESGTLNGHPSFKALGKAIDQYNDALTLWRHCHEGKCYNSVSVWIWDFRRGVQWLPANLKLKNTSLSAKYRELEQTSNLWGRSYIQLNEALPKIWDQAGQNVRNASNQLL